MEVEKILENLIFFPTVTPNECGIYQWIMDFLGDEFVWERLDCGEVKNLFGYRDFAPKKKNKKFHLCFAGHIDVVPAGEGWESDPFVPMIKDGYIFGRGAQDMKGGIASFLGAIQEFEREECDLIVSILLTSDEEGKALDGTKFVLEELEKRNFLPNFALVAEPTSHLKIADTIKIGRRGSINGVIEIEGVQGHVAYPQKCINPVELLGERLGKIAGFNLDDGDDFFEPSKIVVTDIRGGIETCNVTPSKLKIMFNVRNSTASSEDTLRQYLQGILDGLPYHLTLQVSSYPFMTQSLLFDALSQSIEKITGYTPNASTTGGTSDARYFAAFGVEVLELGGLNDRIHAKNECASIKDLETLKEIFLDFLSQQGGH